MKEETFTLNNVEFKLFKKDGIYYLMQGDFIVVRSKFYIDKPQAAAKAMKHLEVLKFSSEKLFEEFKKKGLIN